MSTSMLSEAVIVGMSFCNCWPQSPHIFLYILTTPRGVKRLINSDVVASTCGNHDLGLSQIVDKIYERMVGSNAPLDLLKRPQHWR